MNFIILPIMIIFWVHITSFSGVMFPWQLPHKTIYDHAKSCVWNKTFLLGNKLKCSSCLYVCHVAESPRKASNGMLFRSCAIVMFYRPTLPSRLCTPLEPKWLWRKWTKKLWLVLLFVHKSLARINRAIWWLIHCVHWFKLIYGRTCLTYFSGGHVSQQTDQHTGRVHSLGHVCH